MLLGLGCKEAMQYSEMYDGSNAIRLQQSNQNQNKNNLFDSILLFTVDEFREEEKSETFQLASYEYF